MIKKGFIKYSDGSGNLTKTGPYSLNRAEKVAAMMNNRPNARGFYWVTVIGEEISWQRGKIDILVDIELNVLKHIYKAPLTEGYYKRLNEYLHAAKLGADIMIQNMITWRKKDG